MGKERLVRLRNYLGKQLFRIVQKLSVDPLRGPTVGVAVSVISPQLKPDELKVSPSNPYAEDLLRREPFGKGLSRLVNYGSGTGVVLIDADWGSGKTTFLRMWIQQARNDGNVVALVNAWEGDYRGSPLEYLAERLTRALERYVQGNIFTRMVTRIRQVWFRLSGSILRVLRIGTAVASPIDGGAAWISTIALRELILCLRDVKHGPATDGHRLKSMRDKLRRAASTLWSRRNGQRSVRFVIVIDELDRCRPDYAVRFLETIKHVFEVEHVTFVIAANSTELGHAMSGVYGDEFDGERYLERFFDIRLQLPEGTRDVFVNRVVEAADLPAQFGSELPRDEWDDSITAERVVAYMLQYSTLSLREIHKTLNHIKVMLLFYRSQLASYVLTALVLTTLRSVAREAYDSLEDGGEKIVTLSLFLKKLGKVTVKGDPVLEFVDDVLYWCRQTDESELRDKLNRGRDSQQSERRLARKHSVDYRVVRDAIEMTAPASDSL